MVIPAGYQWVHMTMRRRIVEQLDKLRGQTRRDDYLAGLIESELAARRSTTSSGAGTNSDADAKD